MNVDEMIASATARIAELDTLIAPLNDERAALVRIVSAASSPVASKSTRAPSGPLVKSIARVFAETREPMRVVDVVKALHRKDKSVKMNSVRTILAGMANTGEITRISYGLYRATDD